MSNKLEFQIPEKDLIKYQESFEKLIETSLEFQNGFKELELIIVEKFQEPFSEIYQALKKIESQIDEFKEQN
jgi:hypothetical protein